jgi:hypothetical protein
MKRRWIVTEAGKGGITSLRLFIGTNDEARKYLGQKLNHAKEFWWGEVSNVSATPIDEDIDGGLHAKLSFRIDGDYDTYFFEATPEDAMVMETYGPSQLPTTLKGSGLAAGPGSTSVAPKGSPSIDKRGIVGVATADSIGLFC